LRHYGGSPLDSIDQIAECVRLLKADPTTRRAVMTIFDPELDYIDTKDVPCNNWIHWLIRDGKLNMYIAQRSSDILYGFSGINTFEWSVLHEMMAYWTRTEVGTLDYMISSLHLYSQHYSRAEKILTAYSGGTVYDDSNKYVQPSEGFSIEFASMRSAFARFFELEGMLRDGTYVGQGCIDPFLTNCLKMLEIYTAIQNLQMNSFDSEDKYYVIELISRLPDNDFKLAAIMYFEHAISEPIHNIINMSYDMKFMYNACHCGHSFA